MARTHARAETGPRGFADTIWARLIALAIAVVLCGALWATWSEEFLALFEGQPADIPLRSLPAPDAGVNNEALQNCLDRRLGDVERMASEGIINDAQKAAFSQRATELCRSQNPG